MYHYYFCFMNCFNVCVCILLFNYFDWFMNYLVHFALWPCSETDAIPRHAVSPELPFSFKKIGVIFKNPHFSSLVYVTITSVGVVGGKRDHAMSLCKLHQSHQISSVFSHTSQPATPHDGATTRRADQEASSLRAFCYVRLTCRSHTWDEVQGHCMYGGPCMFDHAR